MANRRAGERRGDERRTFRSEGGRRDEQNNRRTGVRKFLLPALLVLIPLLVGLAWRTAILAPRRAAEIRATEVRDDVASLAGRTALPMLQLPGGPAPSPLPPGDPLPELTRDEQVLVAEVHDRLSPSLRAAPTLAVVPATLGSARFLAGNERGARKAWESLLAVGGAPEQASARVGLGVIAIRMGASLEDPQDQAFAFTEALRHLDRVTSDDDVGAAARFDRAVALALLDRPDDARAQAAGLEPAVLETLHQWLDQGAPPATLMEEVQ